MTDDNERLREDLCKQSGKWLGDWVKRTTDLYRMGDLEPNDVVVDISFHLINVIAKIAAIYDIPPEAVARMVYDVIKHMQESEKHKKDKAAIRTKS